jgi:hypothetical protein
MLETLCEGQKLPETSNHLVPERYELSSYGGGLARGRFDEETLPGDSLTLLGDHGGLLFDAQA